MIKVGVIGPVTPDSFADNVLSTLAAMKLDSVSLGSASFLPKGRVSAVAVQVASKVAAIDAGLQAGVVRRARSERPDIVLSVEGTLLPSTVRALKRLGALVTLWFPDAIANLGRQLMFMAEYDAIFFKEPRLVDRATQLLELPISYLPEACNPLWHRPPGRSERNGTVLVAGNMYPFRVRLLERLCLAGLPLEIYGPPWPRWLRSNELSACHRGRYISRHEKAAVFRAAGVVLNTLHPSEVDGVNCRLFEATACGAAVLTEWRAEAEQCFDVTSEIAAFRSFDELVDRARHLLSDDAGSRVMGDLAATRALREHTYEHRLTVILNALGCAVDG